MRDTLFRREAVDFARDKPLGTVTLVRPFSASVLMIFAVIVAAALLAFAFFGQYTRKAHVAGYLVPTKGIVKVYAPSFATVVKRHVNEGQRVQSGEPLFVLSMEARTTETPAVQAAAIAQLKQRRDSLVQQLAQQGDIRTIERRSQEQRVASLTQETLQLNGQVDTQQARIRSARSTLARYQALQAQKFVSDAVLQQKQDDLLEQQARLQVLERSSVTLSRELSTLRLEIGSNELKSQTERETVAREVSTIDQQLTETEAKRTLVIVAPATGVVTTVLAAEGQNATSSTPLLSILPEGATLQAELLIPSRSIGFVAREQAVALRYQAFPYQRFGPAHGKVTEISRTLIAPGDTTLPISLKEPAYRVTVALDAQTIDAYQKPMPLQAGMVLDADVLLDRRRLIDWVFDPIYSLTRRV